MWFSALISGVTRSELDRYTDKLENVLNDERGRRFFRDFLMRCDMEDEIRSLTLWEQLDKLFAASLSQGAYYAEFQRQVEVLIESQSSPRAVVGLDLRFMETLVSLKNFENKDDQINTIKVLKNEVAKTMLSYERFKIRCVERRNSASFICPLHQQ